MPRAGSRWCLHFVACASVRKSLTWDLHLQARKMCCSHVAVFSALPEQVYFSASPTSRLPWFSCWILLKIRDVVQPSSKGTVFWRLHAVFSTHVSGHAHKAEDLELKLCKDTVPSSHADSERNNRIPRNFSYEAKSHTPLSHNILHHPNLLLHCLGQGSETQYPTDMLSHPFIASKATSGAK